MSDEKCCFVIAPIGESDSDTRKRSDQVLKHIIRPAVEACGYKAQRADEIDKPGIITSQVIQRVVGDPLVIADLTERNPNVFYELAIRHAIRKPLVQIIKKGERIPFDVAGTRTIQVDHKDLDSVEEAKKEIIAQIKELEKDSSELETPISVSLELQLLRQSENPEERSLADLVSSVSELRTSITKIEAKIGTSDTNGILDEIKSKLNKLPRALEEYADIGGPSKFRRSRMHPMMFREIAHMSSRNDNPSLEILIIASYFKDSVPWLYEIGVEAYRLLKSGLTKEAQETLETFRRTMDFTMHSKMSYELFGPNSKDMMMFFEDIVPYLDDLVNKSIKISSRKRRTKSDTE